MQITTTLIKLVGEVSLLILIPLAIVILFYLIKIAKSLVERKTESFSFYSNTGLSPDKRVKLEKIKEKSDNEDIKIIADALLSAIPITQEKTPLVEQGSLRIKEEKRKPAVEKGARSRSKAHLAYERAMQEENPEKRILLLQKVVTKYFDSEWADKALEEIIKAKQG